MVGSVDGVKATGQLVVELSHQEGKPPTEEAIRTAADQLLSAARDKTYAPLKNQRVRALSVGKGVLKFALEGYQPLTRIDAIELTKAAMRVAVRSWKGARQRVVAIKCGEVVGEGKNRKVFAYLTILLPAEWKRSGFSRKLIVEDKWIRQAAQRIILKTVGQDFKNLPTKSIERDERGRTDQLELSLKGYQPKTVAEAEKLIRQAIK